MMMKKKKKMNDDDDDHKNGVGDDVNIEQDDDDDDKEEVDGDDDDANATAQDHDDDVDDANNDVRMEPAVVMEEDVRQFLSDNNDDDDRKQETKAMHDQHQHSDLEDSKQAIETEQQEMVARIVQSAPSNPNKVKQAVSKVKGLMSDMKEKANKNGDRLRATIKQRLPHNLFAKRSMNEQSYQHGYIPFSLQIANYFGHRTVETVKECNFFGPRSEYVISGSDCGHAFIWRKSDGKIVNVLKGDARITNVVQGNPMNCSLVTSGLDSTVKLFTPTATVGASSKDGEQRQKKWNELVQDNENRPDSSRTIPMSLLIYLLRRGLHGDDDDDHDDDDDDDDDAGDRDGNEQGRGDDDDDEDANQQLISFLEQNLG